MFKPISYPINACYMPTLLVPLNFTAQIMCGEKYKL
jgi:hypothetical protein